MNILKKSTNKILAVCFALLLILSPLLGSKAYAEQDYTIKAYAGIGSFSLYISGDDKLYSVGENGSGQLGIGTTVSHFNPQYVLDDVDQIAVGGDSFAFALKKDGTLYAWGKNRYGELGLGGDYNEDSATNHYSTPTKVQINFNIKQIVCGNAFAVILTDSGKVYSVGSNYYGQLGLQSDYKKTSVVTTFTEVKAVSGLNIKQIAAADYATYVLTNEGDVYAFGDNYYGELGSGSDTKHPNDSVPQKCLVSNVVQVSACGSNAMALTLDGKVYVWGRNQYSQIGNSVCTENYYSTPILISKYYSGDAEVSCEPQKIFCAGSSNFVLSKDGNLFAFGTNGSYNCGIDNGGKAIASPTKITFYKALDIQQLKSEGADDVVLSSVPVDKTIEQAIVISNFIGGCDSRVFVEDDNGLTWSFGNNGSTQLCVGNTSTATVPVRSTLFRVDSYDGEYQETDYFTFPIIFLCILSLLLVTFIFRSEIKMRKQKKKEKEMINKENEKAEK